MAKQIKVREDNYFAVQGWMVTELKLKGNALMLYAIIYGFSQTTNTAFTGSVDYLCEWLGGVSRPTVINTLDNLVKQGLLTKSSTTKGALIYNSYTALRSSKKILSDEDPTSKKTLPDTSKNFLLKLRERNLTRVGFSSINLSNLATYSSQSFSFSAISALNFTESSLA